MKTRKVDFTLMSRFDFLSILKCNFEVFESKNGFGKEGVTMSFSLMKLIKKEWKPLIFYQLPIWKMK